MSEVTKEMVRHGFEAGVINGDGHTIFDPKFYENAGFDVSHLVSTFESDLSSGKSTIFRDGVVQNSVTGVYSLMFHEWLGRAAGVEWMTAFGRGTQARRIAQALREWANG